MADTYSFDVVSDFDRQELVNTIDQVRRDVGTRYDLKDSNTEIEVEEVSLTITTASDSTAAAITTARIGHNHIQRLANSGHFTNLMATSVFIAGAPA